MSFCTCTRVKAASLLLIAADARADRTFVGGLLRRPAHERRDDNQKESISFAAYGCALRRICAS